MAVKQGMAKTPKNRSTSTQLAKLGLKTDQDLILHLPLRYEDETRTLSIQQAAYATTGSVQIEAVVIDSDIQFRPRRQLVVRIADQSETLSLRFLHFYGSQIKQFEPGKRIRVRGELRQSWQGLEMVHPTYQFVNESTPLPTHLTPVYPAGEGISQNLLRREIKAALKRSNLSDTLPEKIRQSLKLPDFSAAIELLHAPLPTKYEAALTDRSHPAWQRIKFDELLAQQLSMKRAHRARRQHQAKALPEQGKLLEQFMKQLPFKLTAAQERVVGEIRKNLAESFPMQRLLQGDVGSGKTVVAAIAAVQAIDNAVQVALMAPTEILAEQHFQRIAEWLEPLGVCVVWLTGSQKKKEKERAQTLIESGEAQLVIGTHALIQDSIQFSRLGLIIVDEQHRFGVDQRLSLRNKTPDPNDMIPHQLMMSATPIPRTLAMTWYADLDVSVIDALPPGRKPVITRLVSQGRREEVISRVHAAVQSGRQAYWVCPLIEESEVLQLQTAESTCALLKEALPDVHIGLLHGRLKSSEKQQVMEAFVQGKIQLLVATTVIEVGVDVPNASLMIIENSERFGLSQLHQLRGRIGRGAAESVCLLLYQQPLGATAQQRLSIMRDTQDGFEIARRDLEIRGPGEFLGARQSGQAMLRFADLETDLSLIEAAAYWADWLLETPGMASVAENHLERWMGYREAYLGV